MPLNALPESDTADQAGRALGASVLAWLLACGATVALLRPAAMGSHAGPVPPGAVEFLLALALPLHWLALAAAARRMGRRSRGWVSLALVFPVGGAAALMLLAGLRGGAASRTVTVR